MSSTKNTERAAESFDFRIVLSGVDDITTRMENSLFEAGCDDATLSCVNRKVSLDFSRESASFDDALASAIECVRNAGFVVDHIEPIESESIELFNALLLTQRMKPTKKLRRVAASDLARGRRGVKNKAAAKAMPTAGRRMAKKKSGRR